MSRVLLVRGARQLVTMAGPPGPRRGAAMRHFPVIPDGALLIVDDTIVQVGPTRRVEHLSAARQAEVIDAAGHVVLPGFVDPFARLLCGPARSPDSPGGDPFPSARRALRSWSPQRLELEGRKRLRHFLRSGSTTVFAACGYGLDDATELRALRVLRSLDERPLAIVPAFAGASGCPPEFPGPPADYLAWVTRELLPTVVSRRLSRDVVLADAFPPAALCDAIDAAHRLGCRAHLLTSGAAVLPTLHSQPATCLGLAQLDPPSLAALASSPSIATLLPGEPFHLGASSYPPARLLIDSGAAVALASGYDHLLSPTPNPASLLSLAVSQMKLTPEEAFIATTINAAHAIGLANHLGSLEAGKRADLLLMACGDYRDIPRFFGVNFVALVLRNGREVYPNIEQV